MSHDFDKTYWEEHWTGGSAAMEQMPANPYLVGAISGLTPGTALDAGCGAGAEAIWLANHGWEVTAADISADALRRARRRAADSGLAEQRVTWVEADLTRWTPDTQYGLVTTNYAHPSIPQLDFYSRLGAWVAPGGTLLIVGHLHTHGHGHGHQADPDQHPPAEATVTLADITALLDDAQWQIVTAEEHLRTLTTPDGRPVSLSDVVVQATRR